MKLSHRNQGAVALAKTGKTQKAIAARVNSSQAVVAYWLSGERVPRGDFRVALRSAYAIPLDAWDRPVPKAAATTKKPKAKEPELEVTPVAKATEVNVPSRALRLDAMLHELLEHVHQDQSTSDLEKAKVLASCTATLTLLGKLTGQTQDVNEAKILRLPAWQRIQEALLRVLSKWPDALREVGAELQRMGGET